KDYDDTFVRAEISGRAGRTQLELGARVTGPGDLLTTVERVDPIYVNFSPSDQDVLRWRRDVKDGRLVMPKGPFAVQVTLADGGSWLIAQGLAAGDRVVVDGLQQVAPGSPVRAVAYQPAADSGAARSTP